MADLKLAEWEGDAEVHKDGRNLRIEWPCGAMFFISPKAVDRLIEQFETVRKIKGAMIPATGLKTKFGGTFNDVTDLMLEVEGTKITPIADYERSGTFTVADLKRAVKKALA